MRWLDLRATARPWSSSTEYIEPSGIPTYIGNPTECTAKAWISVGTGSSKWVITMATGWPCFFEARGFSNSMHELVNLRLETTTPSLTSIR